MSDSIFRKDGTAQGVAKQRLIESLAKPGKRVIYDPFADKFVLGSGIIKIMGHKLSVWITKKFAPGFHEHLISRTRFIDDLVEESADEGIEQYVILGAGYDLRAHRLNLPSSVKVFEVDQAEVQATKRAKLPKDIANAANVKYVSIDFNTQSLKEQLIKAGFDSNKSSLFTLEGVSQYITRDAVKSTLQEIAELTQNSSTIFYMSFVDKLLKEDPKSCFGKGYPKAEKIAETVQNLSANVGEPWISMYSSTEIEELLSENGFKVIANKILSDLNEPYFTPLNRTIAENEIFNLEHSVVAKK